jgi:hypothetical protein
MTCHFNLIMKKKKKHKRENGFALTMVSSVCSLDQYQHLPFCNGGDYSDSYKDEPLNKKMLPG